jgi:translation initiation factor RLI1
VGERFFESFEDREAYLRLDLGVPLQRRHDGPATFFSDFQSAIRNCERPGYSLVTPNPLDYLPFDRVRLILNASARLGDVASEELGEVIKRFQLEDLLQRQIYSLSGGETFRVAMGKSALEARTLRRLYFAAPKGALSEANRRFFDEVISDYSRPDLS